MCNGNFLGLVCRRYLARSLAGKMTIHTGFSWPFSVMLDEPWSRTSLDHHDFFFYIVSNHHSVAALLDAILFLLCLP